MKLRKLVLCALVVAPSLLGGVANARPIPVTLVELVNYSDVIVEGIVERETGTAARMMIRVATVHRGDQITPNERLPLRAAAGQLDEATLNTGQMYLFFLADCTNGYRPIFGYAGRVPIATDDQFSTGGITGQPGRSTRNEFLHAMHQLPNLPTLRAVPREWLCRT